MKSSCDFDGIMSSPIISFDQVSFHFQDQSNLHFPTLRDINLKIFEGEYVALVGANGSGKTTLARHINGLLIPTQGLVKVMSLNTRERTNLARIRQLVGMVFQFPEDQIIATTIEEDVAFGMENLGFSSNEIRDRVESAIQDVGLQDERARSPHMLSAGQMQRLALAGVMVLDPMCIIFDEATTMLDPLGRRMALGFMDKLHKQGKTILTITHHMEEAAIADRIIVLKDGEVIADGSPARIFSDSQLLLEAGLEPPPVQQAALALSKLIPQISPGIVSEVGLYSQIPEYTIKTALRKKTKSLVDIHKNPPITINDVSYSYLKGTPLEHPALFDVSLLVSGRGMHGFAGATGSGKTTLLQHLNGVLRPQAGSIRVENYDLSDPEMDTFGLCRMAALVFQIPEQHFFEQLVGDEIAFGPRQFFPSESPRERVRSAMEFVGLDFSSMKDRFVANLSGGEKRKVALAAALACQPEILLLDEPTAGLDPVSRAEVIANLRHLAEQGKTIIISSHRMDDLSILTEDLSIFYHGHVLFTGTTNDVFNQRILLENSGLETPLAFRICRNFREHGWPIPQESITLEALIDTIHDINGRKL